MKTKPRFRTSSANLRRGFTLIEIVIVLTILAILGGSAIYLLKGLPEGAKETRVDGDLAAISMALMSYEQRALRMPTTEQGLKALVERPATEPVPERWSAVMEDVPKDPWGQEYKYRYPAQKSKKSFDLWTMGKDGQDGTDDDIGNWKKTATK